jgi:hypothetical protein
MDIIHRIRIGLTVFAACALSAWSAIAPAREDTKIRSLLETAPAVSFVHYHAPPMFVTTPAQAAGGGLISAATHSEQLPSGPEIEKAFAIPDAGSEIAAQLAARLTSATFASRLHAEEHPHARAWRDDATAYKSETQDPLVLELVVDRRSAAYLPLKWKTYYYSLSLRLRLIDLTQSKVVWEHRCNPSGLRSDTYRLNVDEFEANGGARLKQVEQAANDFCARELGDLLVAN